MPLKILSTLFLFFGFISSAQVVINEIDVDMSGSDVEEIIELKSDTPNFSLDGYVLVLFNETNSLSYYSIDLDGYSTDINGIFLSGNTAVSPAPTLVFPNGKIQNGPDVIALYQANATDFPDGTLVTSTNLVNAIAYATNSSLATNLMSALGLTISTNENVNSLGITQSIQRKNDGTYEVKTPTPGMPNDGSGIVLNYITVSTSQTSYNEGEIFDFVFTTSQPVAGSDLLFNFTIVNGNFMVNDYTSTNLTVLIPVGQSTASNTCTLFDDITDEGDEELLIDIQAVPTGYVINNDNLILRIYDNDYIVQSYGTPLNPTYGLVTPTIPTGYYDSLEGLSGNTLKQELQNIIASSNVRLHSYADIWEIIRTADQNPLNSNQIWDMYLEVPMSKLDQQNTSSIVGKWNREHIFPQSRGGFEVADGDYADGINIWLPTSASNTIDGVSDAHHIRAENGQENSSRNNKNYGNVNSSTVYAGPFGTQGSWRGDVARALFYMAVRFDGLNVVNGDPNEYLPSTTISSGNIGDLASLLTWNTTDPRDDFEMNRNNYIYTWQMNRNPFIDYPNLADYIFGANFGQPWSSTLSTQNPIENRVVVYPNPATEYLIVSGLEGSSKVEIYTITGQLVQIQNFENNVQINLDLNAGMYLVKVTNGFQSTTKKIIVK
ncbi:endonuclease [Flavobacterium sp. HXWNR29]|uniref:endonuclease n=1 Tax=Flavobacterium odoriferum TaxID=2946604 RepID=UPI0021CB49A8|nr:endonuclease [Flavobacterium sp. HXWNR29]MCU4189382.1 endonuclease [Flavobacterium sp. HXWNR29]